MVKPVVWSLIALYAATLAALPQPRYRSAFEGDLVGLLAGTVMLGTLAWQFRQHRVQGGRPARGRRILIVSAALVSVGLLEAVVRIFRAWPA